MNANGHHARIPVLAFHAIGPGRGPTWFPDRAFAEMLDRLLARGYRPVLASDVARGLGDPAFVASKPLAITFDDGYVSVYSSAFPILAARRIAATVFVVTGTERRNVWDPPAVFGGGLELLDRGEIEELAAAGWEIGTHTHTHARLEGASAFVVDDELRRSLDALAAIGITASTMAYPYGANDQTSRDIVRAQMTGGFGIGVDYASQRDDRALIGRIDAHYLRSTFVHRHLEDPIGIGYLAARRHLRELREGGLSGYRAPA